jgi:hypothetical protein
MKATTMLALLGGGFLSLAAVGCSTVGTRQAYDGPARPPQEVATIVGTTNSAFSLFSPAADRISLMAINDDNTSPWYSLSPYPTAVSVLPGRTKVDVQYEHIHGVARGPVWVEAQSNRVYRIKVMNPQSRTQRIYFVVEDITGQSLVGGASSSTP